MIPFRCLLYRSVSKTTTEIKKEIIQKIGIKIKEIEVTYEKKKNTETITKVNEKWWKIHLK